MFGQLAGVGALACLGTLALQWPAPHPRDLVALPLLAALLLGLLAAVRGGWLSLIPAARVALLALTVYFLVGLWPWPGSGGGHLSLLSESTYWFPVLYAGAFLLFAPREALRWSAVTYLLALGVCLYRLFWGPEARSMDLAAAVIQFQLVGLIMILMQATFGAQRGQLLAARQAARQDPLTGLANRRAGEERLAALAGTGQPFTLVVFDLDHFKAVNDTHGHAVGDRVLQMTARLLRELLPRGGVAARWGGEEFMLILPPLELEALHTLLTSLRTRLAQERVDGVQGVTASFGVATSAPGEPPGQVVARADAAMYAAKLRGRDGVQHAEPASPL
ncbi:hypothetical protein RDMS_04225 [Deinococcus sp. RL]|nr:hypothetical protein RDMS_04225 [Deinococcus sp. RL]